MEKYQNYVRDLTEACQEKSWKIHKRKINSDYDFLSLRVNEGASRSICFSAGIHGDEPAGPMAILKFVQEVKIPEDVFVMLLPVVNPWGFNKSVRTNAFKQDINRLFCDKFLTGEAKTAYSLLKKFPVSLFCSLHECASTEGFYMYASDKTQKEKIAEIPKIAEQWFKVLDKRKINEEKVEKGIIWHPESGYDNIRGRCTLENKMFEDKVQYVCLETPSKSSLSDRSTCQFQIMKYLMKIL